MSRNEIIYDKLCTHISSVFSCSLPFLQACGFDWGDCCFCFSVEDADSLTLHDFLVYSHWYVAGFDCLDPNAGDELHGCIVSPMPPLPCTGDIDNKLVVERLDDVHVLAETVNCTGGAFEVEWKGNIVVDEGIVVPTGTMVNITGIGPNATIDGGGVTRLFTVVNGTLHVTNLSMANGSSVFGGAIYSSSSTLTFNGTSFVDNIASVSGGALLVSDGSNASFRETVFSANKAPAGGAVHLSNARALWQKATIFSTNTADFFGGAVHVTDGGNTSWVGETIFTGNTAGSEGGALYVDDDCKASWTGVMTFSGNVASYDGGAMYASDGSEVWWAGETVFSRNLAGDQGGAVSVEGTIRCSSTAKATFISNIATNEGGALHVGYDGNVSWGRRHAVL